MIKMKFLKIVAQIEFTKIQYQWEFRDLRTLTVVAIGEGILGGKGKN